MRTRRLSPSTVGAIIFVAAFSLTLGALQVTEQHEVRRRAFDRGRAAGTCQTLAMIYGDTGYRPETAADLMGWCQAWKEGLKP